MHNAYIAREKKTRIPIPDVVAAEVLFRSDRTCCVCRRAGKPIQIHHIDEDPSNNDPGNLAVLCFDCHRETQIRGGFDRKLDAEQVRLYRDDWVAVVADRRATQGPTRREHESVEVQLELATSLAEIYREQEDWVYLAIHYAHNGNDELRDKYIDRALEVGDIPASTEVFLRAELQGRPDLIPAEVADQAIAEGEGDPLQQARVLDSLRRTREAVDTYLVGIREALQEANVFATAFYLNEICNSGLIEELFKVAYEEAKAEGDLWWQNRALQELGWEDERRALLLAHADEIRTAGQSHLLVALAWAEGDRDAYVEAVKMDALDLQRGAVVLREEDGEGAAEDQPGDSAEPP